MFSNPHTGTSDPSSASSDDGELTRATLLHDSVCSSLSLLFRFPFNFPYQCSTIGIKCSLVSRSISHAGKGSVILAPIHEYFNDPRSFPHERWCLETSLVDYMLHWATTKLLTKLLTKKIRMDHISLLLNICFKSYELDVFSLSYLSILKLTIAPYLWFLDFTYLLSASSSSVHLCWYIFTCCNKIHMTLCI